MAKKQKIAPGVRVRTNEKLKTVFPDIEKPWTGEVLRPHVPISGCWTVKLDGNPVVQHVHENFLEVVS